MSNSPFFQFLDAISHLARSREKFVNTLNDPEKKAKCVGYGVKSIILAIINPIIAILLTFGLQQLLNNDDWLIVLSIFIIIILFFVAIYLLLYLIPSAFVSAIRQIRLDKKAIGIVGLILNVVSVGVIVLYLVQNLA